MIFCTISKQLLAGAPTCKKEKHVNAKVTEKESNGFLTCWKSWLALLYLCACIPLSNHKPAGNVKIECHLNADQCQVARVQEHMWGTTLLVARLNVFESSTPVWET